MRQTMENHSVIRQASLQHTAATEVAKTTSLRSRVGWLRFRIIQTQTQTQNRYEQKQQLRDYSQNIWQNEAVLSHLLSLAFWSRNGNCK